MSILRTGPTTRTRIFARFTLAFVLLDEESLAACRWVAAVWGGGIESSDWPPKKGPARELGARMLGAVR
jgi:hypothetical protein